MILCNLTMVGNLMILRTLAMCVTLMSLANVGHNSC